MRIVTELIDCFQLAVVGNSKHKLLAFPHPHFQLFGAGTFLQNADTNDSKPKQNNWQCSSIQEDWSHYPAP